MDYNKMIESLIGPIALPGEVLHRHKCSGCGESFVAEFMNAPGKRQVKFMRCRCGSMQQVILDDTKEANQ